MGIEVNITKQHIVSLVLAIAMVAGISYAIAQTPAPDPGHSADQIGPGTFYGISSDIWSFPGSVGIGETSPAYELDVKGSHPTIRLAGTESGSGSKQFMIQENTGTLQIRHWATPSPFSWKPRLAIDSSGNVGIGTTNPGAKLDVAGDVKVSGSVTASSFSNSITCNWAGDKIVQSDEETQSCSNCCSGAEWCSGGVCQKSRTNLLRTTCSGEVDGEVTAMNYEYDVWSACYCTGTCTSYYM